MRVPSAIFNLRKFCTNMDCRTSCPVNFFLLTLSHVYRTMYRHFVLGCRTNCPVNFIWSNFPTALSQAKILSRNSQWKFTGQFVLQSFETQYNTYQQYKIQRRRAPARRVETSSYFLIFSARNLVLCRHTFVRLSIVVEHLFWRIPHFSISSILIRKKYLSN